MPAGKAGRQGEEGANQVLGGPIYVGKLGSWNMLEMQDQS